MNRQVPTVTRQTPREDAKYANGIFPFLYRLAQISLSVLTCANFRVVRVRSPRICSEELVGREELGTEPKNLGEAWRPWRPWRSLLLIRQRVPRIRVSDTRAKP